MKSAKAFKAESQKLELLQRGATGSYKSRRALRLGLRWGSVMYIDLDGNFQGLTSMIPPELADTDVFVEDFITEDDKKKSEINGVIDLDVLRIRQYNNFQRWLRDSFTKPAPANTIILDTYTVLSEMALSAVEAMPEYKDPKFKLQMFGEVKAQLVDAVKKLKHLKANIIINCHEVSRDGSLEILGVGGAADYWTNYVNEKQRLSWNVDGKLMVQLCGSSNAGLKTSRADLADAKGFCTPDKVFSLFDDLAMKQGQLRDKLVFPGEKF